MKQFSKKVNCITFLYYNHKNIGYRDHPITNTRDGKTYAKSYFNSKKFAVTTFG